jgi:hypothetical protein
LPPAWAFLSWRRPRSGINIEGVVYRRIKSVPQLKVPLNLTSRRGCFSDGATTSGVGEANSEEFS